MPLLHAEDERCRCQPMMMPLMARLPPEIEIRDISAIMLLPSDYARHYASCRRRRRHDADAAMPPMPYAATD